MSDKRADPVLVAALVQLAEDHKDFAIADDLRDLAIRAQQYPDMPSTAALQTGLGVAEMAVYRKLDTILKLCEGNGAVVNEAFAKSMEIETTLTQALQRQNTILDTVANRLTTFATLLDEHTDRIAAMMELGKLWERRFEMLAKRVDQHDTMLAAHDARITELEKSQSGEA